MKTIAYIWLIIFLAGCSLQTDQEKNIRHSIDKYLKKIKVPKHTRRNYNLSYHIFKESDYLVFLRKENMNNCNTSIDERTSAMMDHRQKELSGVPLTQVEIKFDSTQPQNVYMQTEDSLSKIKPDIRKHYYNVFAYEKENNDTVWKNTFWLDERYKIVW
jgi:hypothetical protein